MVLYPYLMTILQSTISKHHLQSNNKLIHIPGHGVFYLYIPIQTGPDCSEIELFGHTDTIPSSRMAILSQFEIVKWSFFRCGHLFVCRMSRFLFPVNRDFM